MENLYETRNSIYCYPNTNVLINKLDIRDNKKLEEIERKIVLAKLYDLMQNNIIGNFDKYHFINIHKYLFADIYYFAGKFRNENIAKGSFSFAEWEFIEPELDRILLELKNENFLNGYSKDILANKLAYFLSELNVLHPFREGNGRTIREFIRELAYKNDFIIDYKDVDAKDILDASIKSIVNNKDLANILYNCLKKK